MSKVAKTDKKPEPKCCDTTQEKLRILAIHGYRQNGDTFRQKTGSFRKLVHKFAQFTYITAPHQVLVVENLEELNIGQSGDSEEYGWFFNREDMTFRGIRRGGPAIGYEESVKYIEEMFEEHGPFDGILGFSQGASFVGLLCDLQQRGLIKFKFDFAIMASGFKSDSLPHKKYYKDTLNIPTMHIYGINDKIIPKDMSIELSEAFDDPLVVVHDGGHYLPANGQQKNDYQKFFKTMIVEKNLKNDVKNPMEMEECNL